MVAQDGACTAGLAKCDDLAQRGQRLGAAVDEVADEAQRGVGGEGGQQGLEWAAAALEVADGVRGRHGPEDIVSMRMMAEGDHLIR